MFPDFFSNKIQCKKITLLKDFAFNPPVIDLLEFNGWFKFFKDRDN
jgi:hypothetical protein